MSVSFVVRLMLADRIWYILALRMVWLVCDRMLKECSGLLGCMRMLHIWSFPRSRTLSHTWKWAGFGPRSGFRQGTVTTRRTANMSDRLVAVLSGLTQ